MSTAFNCFSSSLGVRMGTCDGRGWICVWKSLWSTTVAQVAYSPGSWEIWMECLLAQWPRQECPVGHDKPCKLKISLNFLFFAIRRMLTNSGSSPAPQCGWLSSRMTYGYLHLSTSYPHPVPSGESLICSRSGVAGLRLLLRKWSRFTMISGYGQKEYDYL